MECALSGRLIVTKIDAVQISDHRQDGDLY
jgi:hypothetical protein